MRLCRRCLEALCVLLITAVTITSASWTISYVRPFTNTFQEDYLRNTSYPLIEVWFVSDTAQFSDQIERDPKVFLGACSSSASNNGYGFEYWKPYWMKNQQYTLQRQEISQVFGKLVLQIFGVKGFTITQTEVITCIVGTTYVSDGFLEDLSVAFTIEAAKTVAIILKSPDFKTVYYSLQPSTTAFKYTETFVRDNGLQLIVSLKGDAWNPLLPLLYMVNFTCSADVTDTTPCPYIMSNMLQTTKYMTLDTVANPTNIVISVPREVTRLLDVRFDVHLCLNAFGQQYGAKSLPLVINKIDMCFSIVAYDTATNPLPILYIAYLQRGATAATSSELTARRNQIVTTLNCLRGKNTSLSCPTGLFMFIDNIGQEFKSSPDANCLTDLQQISLWSNALGSYLSLGITSFFAFTLSGKNTQLLLSFAGNPEYSFVGEDLLTFKLPYSCMMSLEAPRSNVTIVVLPSRCDDLTWQVSLPPANIDFLMFANSTLANISEKIIWRGGLEIRFIVGGDTWRSDVTNNTAYFLSLITSNRAQLLGNSSDGWTKWAKCVLPEGSLSFATKVSNTTSNGQTAVPDYKVLIAKFQACPQYYFDPNAIEVLSFVFPKTMTTSGLGFNSSDNGTVTLWINGAPPTFSVTASSFVFSQVDFPTASFTIEMFGGVSFSPIIVPQCISDLGASWVTNRLPDPSGWANVTVRDSLLRHNVTSQQRNGYYTILTIAFDPRVTSYATVHGENITIGVLPSSCLDNVSVSVAPDQKYMIQVKPLVPQLQSAIAFITPDSDVAPLLSSFQFSNNNTVLCTANDIRNASTQVVIALKVSNDSFVQDCTGVIAPLTMDGITTVSPQPYGFRPLRSRILNTSTSVRCFPEVNVVVVVLNSGVLQYSITASETMTLTVNASWVLSEQNVGTVRWTVVPSRGSVDVSAWSGRAGLSGRNEVTEEEVRKGLVWFSFRLLGDQWRQERPPYVSMFTGIPGESTGLLSLIGQLVPSVEFFTFTSTETFQYVKVILQSSDTYDISREETVTIRFSADSTSTGLPPTFSDGSSGFTFTVVPSPGRLIMSGRTALTEKIMREGGSRILLTLFGETWRPDAAQCVRNGMRITTSDVRDVLFNTTIVPLFGGNIVRQTPQVLCISLSPARYGSSVYSIGSGNPPDVLAVQVSNTCVSSSLAPNSSVHALVIPSTQGELSLGNVVPSMLTEEVLRTTSVQIQIVVDGNDWSPSVETIANRIRLIQEGFSSSQSPMGQPKGFITHLTKFFSLNSLTEYPDLLRTSRSVTLRTVPQPTYSITEDEVITFSVITPTFMADGALPNPARISFTIYAQLQVISFLYAPPGGVFDTEALVASVASLLAILTYNSQSIVVTNTGRVGLLFSGTLKFNVSSDADVRSNAELTRVFLSFQPSYLREMTGITCAFMRQAVGSGITSTSDYSVCTASATSSAQAAQAQSSDAVMSATYWIAATTAVVGLAALVVVIRFATYKSSLSGAVRPGSAFRLGGEKNIATEYIGEGPVDSHRSVASQLTKPMSLREFAQRRREEELKKDPLTHRQRLSGEVSKADGADKQAKERRDGVSAVDPSDIDDIAAQVVRAEQHDKYRRLINGDPRKLQVVSKLLELEV